MLVAQTCLQRCQAGRKLRPPLAALYITPPPEYTRSSAHTQPLPVVTLCRGLCMYARLTCVCARTRYNTTRSEDETASYVDIYLSTLPYLPTYLSRRYVCTQAACVPRCMAEIPRANNNATSCKWDGYPYTCRRDDV